MAELGFGMCCCLPAGPRSYYVPKIITPCCPAGLPLQVKLTLTATNCDCANGVETTLTYQPASAVWLGTIFSSPPAGCDWIKGASWFCKTHGGLNKMVLRTSSVESPCNGTFVSDEWLTGFKTLTSPNEQQPSAGYSCSPLLMEYDDLGFSTGDMFPCCGWIGGPPGRPNTGNLTFTITEIA